MSFPAKFASRCSNGHKIEVGQYIAFTDQNLIVCTLCPDFASGRHVREIIYSKVMCSNCFIELSIAEVAAGKVKCADCGQ